MSLKLKNIIYELVSSQKIQPEDAARVLMELDDNDMHKAATHKDGVALTGMAARFAGTKDIDEYWDLLVSGSSCIVDFPRSRRQDTDHYLDSRINSGDKGYKPGGYISEIDKFDAAFFRISPKEAELMDPVQRLFLVTAWEALEDAGIAGKSLDGARTGIYVGKDTTAGMGYSSIINEADPLVLTGSTTSILASRLSYILDMNGPAVVLDTACSSGLVALHVASRAISSGEIDTAIVGGVSLSLFPTAAGIVDSPSQTIKAFDKNSNGTVWGEGIGVVVLKALHKANKDRNHIYAIIKGSAINNDGFSNGITAPNAEAQAEVIQRAWQDAGIPPETVSYIEAHGTGTNLGDPIEIKGIDLAFRKHTEKRQFCALGTVKTNIGHLVGASGIASVIKMALALKKEQIPASLNFDTPNRFIDFSLSAVYINDRLTEWKRRESPRRCGISSFGFSGTNCHVILEEAPETGRETDNGVSEKRLDSHILTLSAKNENSLKKLIRSYNSFLKDIREEDIGNICYTANKFRYHYNYRIAMAVNGLTQLVRKMCMLERTAHEDINTKFEGIYFGRQDGFAAGSGKTADDNQTEGSVLGLDLENICKAYVSGNEVDWNCFYKETPYSLVSIPVYQFDSKRFWVRESRPLIGMGDRPGDILQSSLLQRCISHTFDECVYMTDINVKDFWVVNEHSISGNYVIPGTAYIEMAVQAGRELFKDHVKALENIQFYTPLVLKEYDKVALYTVLKKEGETVFFNIASREPDSYAWDGWTTHASGELTLENQLAEPCDLVKLLSGLEPPVPVFMHEGGIMSFGPRWQSARSVQKGKNEALFFLELPDILHDDVMSCRLHPALLDIATSVGCVQLEEESFYLPFSYKKIKIYGSIPAGIYSYIRFKEQSSGDMVKYDITVMDREGNIVADIAEFTLKKARNISSRISGLANRKSMYYAVRWEKEKLSIQVRNDGKGAVVLLNDERGLSGRLRKMFEEEGRRVVSVSIGQSYKALGADSYTIGTGEEDYERLLAEVRDIGAVLHLKTIFEDEGIHSLKELDDRLELGLYSLFRISRVVARNKSKCQFFIVGQYINEVTGSEKEIAPHNTAMAGLGKVVSLENPGMSVRCIDIDDKTTAGQVFSEVVSDSGVYTAAYRYGERYIPVLAKVSMDEVEDSDIEVKEDGVYLITGGTGDIGLEMGKFLAAKNRVTLCLISRSGIPERREWESILKLGGDAKLVSRINRIKEIENTGSKVECYRADVSGMDEMEAVLGSIRLSYGKINGVLHCAGVAGDGFIYGKEEQRFSAVIRPKVNGTWVLDRLTSGDDLDFFIMFSSMTSITGSMGQGDYTAANAYMDCFAAYRHKKSGKTLSINWPAWKETGMARDYGMDAKKLVFTPIDKDRALSVFEEILHKKLHNIAVFELDYNADFDPGSLPVGLEGSIKTALRVKKGQVCAAKESKKSVMAAGRQNGDYSELELKLVQIWGHALGFDEINVYDDFYQLGGDSIQAIKISNAIRDKKVYENIDMADIFQYLTVSELAGFISTKLDKVRTENIKAAASLPEKGVYPLSHSQERIWLLQKIDPDLYAYNLPTRFFIDYEVDLSLLNEAFRLVTERHSILRTVFNEDKGVPGQVLLDRPDFNIEFVDLSEMHNKEQLLEDSLNKAGREVFNLSEQLVKAKLYKIGKNRYCLFLNFHHIIVDGWSSRIIVEELLAFYKALSGGQAAGLEPLKTNYFEYVAKQNKWMQSEAFKETEKYWTAELAGQLPVLNLPVDFERPAKQTYNGSFVKIAFDEYKTERLKAWAKELGTTLHTLFLAAYALLLNQVTGDEDIIIGVPVSGREQKELENVVGLFINTVCIRVNLSDKINFTDVLKHVKEKSMSAYRNSRYPFDLLVSKINPVRDLKRSPLFSSMFQFFDSIPQENDKVSLFELSLLCKETDGTIDMRFEYYTDLFKRDTIERFSAYYKNIIGRLMENPDAALGKIKIMPLDEEKKVLESFNNTFLEYDRDKLINELFEEQAALFPQKTAIVCKGMELTYAQLNKKANQLAETLRKEGVVPDSIVGIMVERSPELIVSIMGVLKAGGAYLPIDPQYPADRIDFMLRDSAVKILIALGKDSFKTDFSGLILDIKNPDLFSGEGLNPVKAGTSQNMAYVIYTSGSTGRPKGVMIEHRAVNNFINGMSQRIAFTEGKNILCLTTVSFDIFVLETLLPLSKGLKTVICDENEQSDPGALNELIIENKIDILQLTPSRMRLLLEHQGPSACLGNVKEILMGGEELPRSLLAEVQQKTTARIYNVYGPTETTVWSAVKELTNENIVNIGTPIANTQIYIVNKSNEPQPVGIAGELCIAGDGLARGYLGRPELTGEKFVYPPFLKGVARVYKTGDLAKWNADGEIEFLGRLDNQVKIRGYRIELEEIEHRLMSYGGIKEAVVIDRTGKNEDKYLCAYIVSDAEFSVQNIRAFLSERLPQYMIPQYFIRLDRLPMTPNGKLDRKLLPEHHIEAKTEEDYVQPQNKLQREIADIWKRVLNLEQVGIYNNFFDLGGNSLTLVQMHGEIEALYPGRIKVSDIFGYSTVAKIAGHISTDKASGKSMELKYISLPEEYFLGENEEGESEVLFIEIREDISEGLKRAALKSQLRWVSIALAAYIYLLATLSEQENLYINNMTKDINSICQAPVELGDIAGIQELFRLAEEIICGRAASAYYSFTDLESIPRSRGRRQVLPLFYIKGLLNYNIKLTDYFDIAVGISENCGRVQACVEYDGKRLEKEKIQQFADGFINLIEGFANEINKN